MIKLTTLSETKSSELYVNPELICYITKTSMWDASISENIDLTKIYFNQEHYLMVSETPEEIINLIKR
jgi:hypothetical protein